MVAEPMAAHPDPLMNEQRIYLEKRLFEAEKENRELRALVRSLCAVIAKEKDKDGAIK